MNLKDKKVSLVLSGGGARGIGHIGVIEELEKHGYEIHSVVGTSMGAVVGAMYSLGKLDEFKQWLLSLDKRRVFQQVDITLSKRGLIKGDKLIETFKSFIPDTKIEELPINYGAVAVDIITGKEVFFNQGSIHDAIRASMSIPLVFTPFNLGANILVDGGVLNNIPVNHAYRMEGDILIAVDVNANISIPSLSTPQYVSKEREHRKEKRIRRLGYYTLVNKTSSLMISRISDLLMEKYNPDLLIKVPRQIAGTFDFNKAKIIIEHGKEATCHSLQKTSKYGNSSIS